MEEEILYDGDLMGDANSDLEVIQVGEPIELTSGDVAEIFEGAPVARKVSRRMKARPRTPAGKAARAATVSKANLGDVKLPHLAVVNGIYKTEGTSAKLAGGSLKTLFERFFQDYPVKSIMKSVAGSADGADKTLTLGKDDVASMGFDRIGSPVLFITITSKNDSTRPGQAISIALNGTTPNGGILTTVLDTIERGEGTKPLKMVYHPFIQIGEKLVPQAALWGKDAADATINLEITIKGLFDGDAVQVTAPGYDSVELQQYLKNFKLNLI